MTNEEKYRTPVERDTAFARFCYGHRCDDKCPGHIKDVNCRFLWLALEAEKEKPLTCPFCGADGIITEVKGGGFKVFCGECLSMSSAYITKDKAIAAWNRRVK